jgi:hypothetical protein
LPADTDTFCVLGYYRAGGEIWNGPLLERRATIGREVETERTTG